MKTATLGASGYLIGLDCGHSAVKAAAFAPDGSELALAHMPLQAQKPRAGWVEFRPEALWDATLRALRELLGGTGLAGREALGICLTGAGNGLILLGAGGKILRNGIYAVDNRAAEIVREDMHTGLAGEMHALNGQNPWTGQTLALLRWVCAHEPEVYARVRRVAIIKEYLKLRLTGEFVSDRSEMAKLGFLDIRAGEPTEELLDMAGVPEALEWLPRMTPAAETIGGVLPEVAANVGLPAGLPVANGVEDIDACALGAGVTDPGQLSVVAGTWSINQLIVDRPVFDRNLFGLSHYPIPRLYEELEASPSSAANLQWFVEHLCRDLSRQAEAQNATVYETIGRAVESVEPAATPVFFHPYLYGSNTEPNARAGFYGLAGWNTRAEMLAALFEGVVYSHNHHVSKLRQLGMPILEARLSGGAARSETWAQMFADVLNVPVVVPCAGETGTLGAATCAAAAVGLHASLRDAVSAMVHVKSSYEPRTRYLDRYARRFETYERITEMMKPVWYELEGFAPGTE